MAIIGYIKDIRNIDGIDKWHELSQKLGCQKIFEDDTQSLSPRLNWRYILENLTFGDTLLIYKLSNALGGWVELPILINLCRSKRIRLVSFEDKLDTRGELYDATANDLLMVLSVFGNETFEKKPRFTKYFPSDLTGDIRREKRRHDKILLEKAIINDYQSEVMIEEISRNRHVSLSTIYSMLRRNGIKPDRSIGKAHSKLNV